VNKVRHFAGERCPVTRLTKLQVCALASACIETSKNIPNGVYRSLVIRGLLTSAHRLTADCREALTNCTILSDKFRGLRLAMPVRPSRHPRRWQRNEGGAVMQPAVDRCRRRRDLDRRLRGDVPAYQPTRPRLISHHCVQVQLHSDRLEFCCEFEQRFSRKRFIGISASRRHSSA
jgi:hypothetical protein